MWLSYMFLFFGLGCLVWQPLALQYGKRPVYLFTILATMTIQLWAPYTKSNGQWIANKILQGFFGAPIESLCEISVTDIVSTLYLYHRKINMDELLTLISVLHSRERDIYCSIWPITRRKQFPSSCLCRLYK